MTTNPLPIQSPNDKSSDRGLVRPCGSWHFDDELAKVAPVLRVGTSIGGPEIHDGSDPAVEARLAEVVLRLRAAWRAGPALLWGDLFPLREVAGSQFEKLVTIALVESFLEYSQLLCGLEVLLLKRQHLGVVSEQSLLSLQQQVVDLADLRGEVVELLQAQGSVPEIAGELEARDDR